MTNDKDKPKYMGFPLEFPIPGELVFAKWNDMKQEWIPVNSVAEKVVEFDMTGFYEKEEKDE